MDIFKYIHAAAGVSEFLSSPEKSQVVEALQELLKMEFQQRDLYEAYDYLLFGPEAIAVQSHLREHIEQEMEHVRTLQRCIVHFGFNPTLERKPIPQIQNLSLKGILAQDLVHENQAVKDYSSFIKLLEPHEEYTALRVDVENILSQESEHVHDLERWLQNYGV